MGVARAQLEEFLIATAKQFAVPPPRVSHREPPGRTGRCRRRRRTLALGRRMLREPLAHQLAHYLQWKVNERPIFQGHLFEHDDTCQVRKYRAPLHNEDFMFWLMLTRAMVRDHFGKGE